MTVQTEVTETSTDVLVIGGGGAGALAAIKAMAEGAQVLLACKGPFPSGNTSIALRGYAVALGYADPRDNPEIHFEDVIRAGKGLNNRKTVRAWVKEIVEVTKEMERWGIDLVKKGDKLDQMGTTGETYPRGVHHYNTSGKTIIQCLGRKSKDMGIQTLEHTIIGGLCTGEKGVVGAWGITYKTGQLIFIKAKAVVLATGGMGHLFPVTDNVATVTGEGYVLAFRAGAELIDMEMAHFLLTTCYPKRMKEGVVFMGHISDLLNRGGARLYNGLGERFMKKDYPDTGEKEKSAEQLIRAIGLEICEGRGTVHGGVYLDASDIPQEIQKTLFPVVWDTFGAAGIDLRCQPIEVVISPHDFLGGVKIDEAACTNVQGLFAAGEVAGGSHGANRLGGSALSDALAFGAIAGRSAAFYAARLGKQLPWDEQQLLDVRRRVESLLSVKDGVEPLELQKSIQAIANRYLNVVRDEEGLTKALQELERIEREMLPRMSAREAVRGEGSTRLREAIEVDGQLELARIIATAALCRKESRGGAYGGHYRRDYPSQDDENWIKNLILKNEKGMISYRAIPPITDG